MHAVEGQDVIDLVGRSLGLSTATSYDAVVKPALRRAVFLLAPCSRYDLVRFVAEPMAFVSDIHEIVEEALEELITYGDILEMRRLETDPWDAPPYVLRPSPPSFVQRSAAEFIILGVSGEVPSALTSETEARSAIEGPVRVLREAENENLAEHLLLLGLSQVSEASWLKAPAQQTAKAHLDGWKSRLSGATEFSVAVNDLQILDSGRLATFYSGRWVSPSPAHDGLFVARRPQSYGSRLWSIVDLVQGVPRQLIDIVSDDDRQRPCDIAWRLQAAIDAVRGSAQCYSASRHSPLSHLDFYSPLPAFAERRLAIVGSKVRGERCLFRFEVPNDRLALEIAALESTLWMRERLTEEQA